MEEVVEAVVLGHLENFSLECFHLSTNTDAPHISHELAQTNQGMMDLNHVFVCRCLQELSNHSLSYISKYKRDFHIPPHSILQID